MQKKHITAVTYQHLNPVSAPSTERSNIGRLIDDSETYVTFIKVLML